MKRILPALLLVLISVPVVARDTVHHLPLQPVLDDPALRTQLGELRFHFGDEPAPQGTDLGEFVTNKKTNAFNKSDVEACNWVLQSALLQLRDRAKELGADAVVDIRSFYKKVEYRSATQYECHAGAIMAGVALKARFVKTH